jgi:hypothetical protein
MLEKSLAFIIALLFGILAVLSFVGLMISTILLRPILLVLFFLGFIIFGILAVVALIISLLIP